MKKINIKNIEKIEKSVKDFQSKFTSLVIAEAEASNDDFRINALKRVQSDNQKAVDFLKSIENAERVSETDENDVTKTFVLVSSEIFEVYEDNF